MVKVEVDQQQVEGRGRSTTSQRSRLFDQVNLKSKVKEVQHGKGIESKLNRSNNKRSIGKHVVTD
jgi:hypothetical protein